MIEMTEQLSHLGTTLPQRERIIYERLLQGPSDRRELGALIAPSPEYDRAMIKQVSIYTAKVRKKLEPLGYTIPRNPGGNPHINQKVEIIKLP